MEIGKKASGGKDERETEDATDGPNEDGKGQKEGAQEEGKKESSRKAEEACLEGLSDEIQDMLVVCGVWEVLMLVNTVCPSCADHAGGLSMPSDHTESSV